jgi:hypothetical protein
MNLARKIEIAALAVTSISRHDDEDAAVRHAALARLEELIKAEHEAMDERVKARIAESLKG